MKSISTSKNNEKVIFISVKKLAGLPKTVPGIIKWIHSMGGRPASRNEKALLVATGNWGMPRE